MKIWHVPIGIVVFLGLFPYIRSFFKRLHCMKKLEKLCRKKGYHLHATHPFWFLGNKYSQKCDLHIETPDEVFAIKFFGMPRRLSYLVIKENGEYFIRNFISVFSNAGGVSFPIESKSKPMPTYDFRYKYRDEWEVKTQRRILLVNPVPREIRHQPKFGTEVVLGSGDFVNGMEMYSLSGIIRILESGI